jgi:hypothetical protein
MPLAQVQAPGTNRPLRFIDSDVTVTAHVLGDSVHRWISLACRDRIDGLFSGYYLSIDPGRRGLMFGYWDKRSPGPGLPEGMQFQMMSFGSATHINGGNASNTLELACVGSDIVARVNGQTVGQRHDERLTDGSVFVGVWGDINLPAEVRVTRLSITGIVH